jgi:hypothetical protein
MAIDYKSFGPNGPSPDNGQTSKRWWLEAKSDIAPAVAGIVKALSEYDSKRQTQYQISTRLYGNVNLMGLNGLSYSKILSVQNTLKDRISYNVIQSVIDTITAKIAKNRPRPMFLTSGGNYKIQRRAKKLDKFVEGCFYENEVHKLSPKIFRDGCIFGDGFVHVFEQNGRVKYERVLPSELYVDPMESFYGEPRQLHRVKSVDRAVLIDLFPEHRKAIAEANSASASLTGAYQNIADQVTVVESWHLPSGPESKDGLHTIIISDKVLFMEDWNENFFPLAHFRWNERLYGWQGQGLAEQIQNIQLEINKLLWVIQRSMHMAGSFKILMENSSKIVKEHFTNDIGAIITYTGTPPQYVTPQAVPMEYYQHFQTLKTSAYEQAGISQLSASAQKPAGLNSGRALREYNDIETERFMVVGQAYENLHLDLAKLTVWKAKEIFQREKKYSVVVPEKKFTQTIDWKDIDLEEDEYVMKIFPISSLPNDPAGRLQTIQEYAQAGFLSPRQARKLLDFPDLEQIEDLATSAEDYLHEILEKIVEEDIYTPPEPFDDLSLAKELALEYYAQGKCNGLEQEKLELLRRFMDQVDMLVQKAMPPAPLQGAPMAQGSAAQSPMANPQATPVSELIPNVRTAV